MNLLNAELSRRVFLGGSIGVAGAVFLASCSPASTASGGTVRVLGFEAYLDQTVRDLWARDHPDIQLVTVPAADSNEILTKVRAGGTKSYDAVFADAGFGPVFERENLVEVIDMTTLDATQDLYPVFREDVEAFPNLVDVDQAIMFPCQWAPTGMTFNTTVDYQPQEPYSWAQMFDPAIPSGKVAFQGIASDGCIATAALAMGYAQDKVYSLTAAELDDVVSYFSQIKPFQLYNSDPQTRNALRNQNTWIALTPNLGFGTRINEEAGEDITISVLPEEGAVGYVDGVMLVKDAQNRDNALTFIDWFGGSAEVRDHIFTEYRGGPCSQVAVEAQLEAGGEGAAAIKEIRADQPELATQIVQGRLADDPVAYAEAWDRIIS